ncbi:FeoA family protein [Ruminococcus sp.]
MGITPGATVKKLKTAPFGDPIVIIVRGYELSLRVSEAKEIFLED